jgi:putative glycerol-1-phosphate prenyltransferase
MKDNILNKIHKSYLENEKHLAILLDPDKIDVSEIEVVAKRISKLNASFVFVGGSLLFKNVLSEFVIALKQHIDIPIILFPGSAMQITKEADAILFLQLLSGRNPDFLIGNQVIAAPILKHTNLEVISTGYLLIESGRETTVSYVSNTKPIPAHKPEIAMATAIAGEYIGNKLIYLDGGSGAINTVPEQMIKKISNNINLPIIVGGGIKTQEQINKAFLAGATIVVIGTAFENNEF